MRFVVTDTVRIDLKGGEWIEIKKELSKGEASLMRSSGLKRMSQGQEEKETAIDVDWKALSMGRVVAYLVDWSAKDAKGKSLKVTPQSIAELCEEDFDEIDNAIKNHVAEQEEAKKSTAGASASATT